MHSKIIFRVKFKMNDFENDPGTANTSTFILGSTYVT